MRGKLYKSIDEPSTGKASIFNRNQSRVFFPSIKHSESRKITKFEEKWGSQTIKATEYDFKDPRSKKEVEFKYNRLSIQLS